MTISGDVLFDLSEFAARPTRTGIQRVGYEILRSWPGPKPLVPFCIPPGTSQPLRLPDAFPSAMEAVFTADAVGLPSALQRVKDFAARAEPLSEETVALSAALIATESPFFEHERARFYERLCPHLAEKIHFFIHDALPWLEPDLFPPGVVTGTMRYVQLLRRLPNLHFSSRAALEAVRDRILRQSGGAYRVCPLGADALGRGVADFKPEHRAFICLGTIEPRKNHGMVLDAFAALWSRDIEAKLVLAGKLGASDAALESRLAWLEGNPRFRWQPAASDADLASLIKASRASLYASTHEGFGLPPLESLALGRPVIAYDRLPSLADLGSSGQIRLPDMTAEKIEEGVLRCLDDEFAAAKTAEIDQLSLPTWRVFAQHFYAAVA